MIMKKKNLIQRLTMPLPELETYYCERRKERFAQGKRLKCIQFREAFYPVFRKFLTLDRLFRKQTVTVIGNNKKYTGQVIYACTHISQNDLENIYETLHRGCWWFVGDPCVLYKDISGLLVYLNGSIFLETGDKDDRRIAYLRAVEVLKGGGSLMIYPEGARNVSENVPVWELFQGTAKMSMETNVKIVPIAIEQFDQRFVINFGNELFPKDFEDNTSLTQQLRDDLATLKWEIWEREGLFARDSLPEDYREKYIQTFAKRLAPWDTLESVERTRFHSKAEIAQKDVESHLDRLMPCRENAFLFRKRN